MAFKRMSFFWSYFENIEMLPEEDQLALYRAIIRYGFLQEEPDITGALLYSFSLIKPNIDATIKSVESGGKGGKPKKQEPEEDTGAEENDTPMEPYDNPSQTPTKPLPNPSVTPPIPEEGRRKKEEGYRSKEVGSKEVGSRRKEEKRWSASEEIKDPEVLDAFEAFAEARKKTKKPMTERAQKLLIKKLYSMAVDDFGCFDPRKAVELLDTSTMKGWLDIYPLKEQKNNQKRDIFAELDALEV